MTLANLLPLLHELPATDKLRAMQFLAADLMREIPQPQQSPGMEAPNIIELWSPVEAYDAAEKMYQMLYGTRKSP